ncbi:hypothetical protein [Pseudonocardia sp. KRD291]|uniref:hypothetical protein n=1 Tax=Pseudonocardia sp. KRD291 TaxID=2792007 RepID=UPI001C4A662B|nr:hypothetical protein [Pseudonocardia sp. KRD291]MBW0101799.1 hypothetical protein [Pseudonocardia sp. KRD291]
MTTDVDDQLDHRAARRVGGRAHHEVTYMPEVLVARTDDGEPEYLAQPQPTRSVDIHSRPPTEWVERVPGSAQVGDPLMR